MKLLIATGIYPPQVGGPAQYAKELAASFERAGWQVIVQSFNFEHRLPTGLRHIFYFLKILPAAGSVDLIIALDTFSVGLPAVLAGRLFGKKVIIRTGGDFFWESYVERTGEKVLLRNFYATTRQRWNFKDRLVFLLTKITLQSASRVVFSTSWQKEIFIPAYGLDSRRTGLIENYYGPKENPTKPASKMFVGATRPLVWKNLDVLTKAFLAAKLIDGELRLDLNTAPYEKFLEKLRSAYAVILVSLGDISPNLILDAIRLGKPFILTRETGLAEKLRGVGIFVDPFNEEEIKEKILELADPSKYERWRSQVEQFTHRHTWDEIRDEFIALNKNHD